MTNDPTSKTRYRLVSLHPTDAFYDLLPEIKGTVGTFPKPPTIPAAHIPPNHVAAWFLPDDKNLGKMYFKGAIFEEVE